MKKSLQELELVTPAIDLLDAHKIVGGYYDIDGGEIPEVVVVGDRDTDVDMDSGYDPREDRDSFEDDLRDDQELDSRHDTEGDRESFDENRDQEIELTVQVPNGWCVLGAVATAIQAKTGCSDTDAVKAADNAFDKCGINSDPSSGEMGIPTLSTSEFVDLLSAAGFEVTYISGVMTSQEVYEHFNSDGAGLGYVNTGENGHMIYLEDYDMDSNSFHYYDPVLGTEGSITSKQCSIILFR